MTGSIVASLRPDVEGAGPLTLADIAMPPVPAAPSPEALARLAASAVAHPQPTVPAGETAGHDDVERVLTDLVQPIEELRRQVAAARPAGFLVTAADVQRHAEVGRRLNEIAAILAERA